MEITSDDVQLTKCQTEMTKSRPKLATLNFLRNFDDLDLGSNYLTNAIVTQWKLTLIARIVEIKDII